MKKIITLIIILLTNTILNAQWGPKIRLDFESEAGQTQKIFIGVDAKATDGWDSAVVFEYNDTTITENYNLPPFPPPDYMYCALERDSINRYLSYVDMRGIPEDSIFFHKYTILIWWNATVLFPYIDVKWGQLPDGIDSAKFRCYQWMDDDYYVDMRENDGIRLDNQAYKDCYVYVWYNKKHIDIKEVQPNILLFPNPANDYITFYNENNTDYVIINYAGENMQNGNLQLNTKNNIDIAALPIGAYYILLNRNGEHKKHKFIKK